MRSGKFVVRIASAERTVSPTAHPVKHGASFAIGVQRTLHHKFGTRADADFCAGQKF